MANQRILRTLPAGDYVGLKPSTLEKMRLRGEGPRFVKLGGRAVGYDIQDLDRWLDERKRASTSETEPAR
jgi:predicted DNA-binding transcriptional regulator AlpA